MKDFLKLFNNLKFDKHNLTIICGITIFIFFILEKIEFRKIILLLSVFCGVFFYYNKNNIVNLVENTKKEKEKVLSPFTNIKGEKNIDIEKKIVNFKLKNSDFSDKIFKLNKLNKFLKRLEDFIKVNYKEIVFSYGDTTKKNLNLNLYHNLKKKTKDYLNQVEFILINDFYLDKSFEKLIAIKKDIIYLIHSIYYKINYEYDGKVNEFIIEIKDIFDSIEYQLKIRINKDFQENPNCLNGHINMEKGVPEKHDPMESLNNITITNNLITL